MENFVNYTRIKDLKNGTRNLNIRAIILEIRFSRMRTQEDFYKLIIADETARINCALFDQRVTLLKPGDIIYLTMCYTKLFKSELTIYKYREGNILKIGEICMVYNDKIDMSTKQEACHEVTQNYRENFIPKKRETEHRQNFQIANDNKSVMPNHFLHQSLLKSSNFGNFKRPSIRKNKLAETKK